MSLEQKWLAGGAAVLVLDPGSGEPTIGDGNNGQMPNPDYRPALVAVLATEYHEPAQLLDADPLAPADDGAGGGYLGATVPGSGVPGSIAGPVQPSPAPQAVPGPATPAVTTRSTAAEDPNVTVPGSAAAIGAVSPAQIVAAIRDLENRAAGGDDAARAELDRLSAAFEGDTDLDRDYDTTDTGSRFDPRTGERLSGDRRDVTGADVTEHPGGDRTQADIPETAPGGSGVADAPAAGTGAGTEPAGPATA